MLTSLRHKTEGCYVCSEQIKRNTITKGNRVLHHFPRNRILKKIDLPEVIHNPGIKCRNCKQILRGEIFECQICELFLSCEECYEANHHEHDLVHLFYYDQNSVEEFIKKESENDGIVDSTRNPQPPTKLRLTIKGQAKIHRGSMSGVYVIQTF